MDALTNTFCAGGNVLGNGTWLNVGSNQAISYGGQPAASQNGRGPYDDPDGRQSIRLLTPCDDGSCDWVLSPKQVDQRWYPTVEILEDGTAIILGGCRNGGFVNDASQDNPTYEFFPPRGPPVLSPILQSTLPANLFPLTWLLPSGSVLVQSNWATVFLDYNANAETPLDDIPDAVRVYPASAGNITLPLTPTNNYTATILFCGGSNVQPKQWTSPDFIVPLHVSQLPPNPAIIAPGPAFIFVVVNGVPSIGLQVILGSGQLRTQTVLDTVELPTPTIVQAATTSASASKSSKNSESAGSRVPSPAYTLISALCAVVAYVASH